MSRCPPLPQAVTVYRQPRKDSDVKGVLAAGTLLDQCHRVPDFPDWYSIGYWQQDDHRPRAYKRGYIHLKINRDEWRAVS